MNGQKLIFFAIFSSINLQCALSQASNSSSLIPAVPDGVSDSVASDSTNRFKLQSPSKSYQSFIEKFSKCRRSSSDFDRCVKDGLNNAKSFITTGVPELNIPAFDPIYAKEVVLKRGGPTFNFKLKLRNVRESGWKLSTVTKFRSDFKQNLVQITQYFPDKHLEGEYEVESMIFQPNNNKGKFNLALYELNQTTTLVKPKNAKSIKVNVDVQEIGNMKLHVSNLLRGRTGLETVLDQLINSAAWRPGFLVVRPMINELVSTAFTDIYNRVFNNMNFDLIVPP